MQCFTRVHVAGLENVPTDGPLILAANHISNADPPFMAVWLTPALGRPIHWMAKAEALDWPIAGWFMRQNGAFGIRRGAADTEAFRLAKSVLDDGRVLGAFPEGTRSWTGALQPAKDGVTLLALRTGAPILPVGVADTDRFWPRGRKLWRVGGRISMTVGEPFVAGASQRCRRPQGVPRRRHQAAHAPHRLAAAGAPPGRLRRARRGGGGGRCTRRRPGRLA